MAATRTGTKPGTRGHYGARNAFTVAKASSQ